MKRLLTLLALSLLLTPVLKAESFKVLHFHSDITLNQDGTFDVVEDILLEFSESKHGFIRKLPYRYSSTPYVQGEVAEGHFEGQDYQTPITDITVQGRAFTVTKAAYDYEIKIGSADEYVSGRQMYRIRYKVYGAINFFSNSSELYWNVNGNDWEVEFDTVDATVHLPTNRTMPEADVNAFTGQLGSVLGGVATEVTPGKVSFRCTRKLAAREGLTITARFPKNYLHHTPVPLRVRADVYMIDSLRIDAGQNEDGSVDVDALLYLDILQGNHDFDLPLITSYVLNAGPKDNFTPRLAAYEILESKVRQVNYDFSCYVTLGERDGLDDVRPLHVPGTSFPKPGKYQLHLRYRLWGIASTFDAGVVCHLPFLKPAGDAPLSAARVRYHWKGAQAVDLKNLIISHRTPKTARFTLQPESLEMVVTEPFQDGEQIEFELILPKKKINFSPIPMRVFSPDHYFSDYHVDLEIRPDGSIHVQNRMAVHQSTWYSPQERPLMMEYSRWNTYEFRPGEPQFWGDRGNYLVSNLQFQGELDDYGYKRDHNLRLRGAAQPSDVGVDTIRYSYDIVGMLRDSAGRKWLEFPLLEALDAPADHVSATITFPSGQLTEKTFSLKVLNTNAYETGATEEPNRATVVQLDGQVEIEYPLGLWSNQIVVLKMDLPEKAVPGSFSVTMRLLWANHRAVFFPFFLILPLVVVWFIWGRDRRFTTVVQFYPPEDLTPAEAGMLIDDKLHNRDLLALIYYWGAQGYISITELYDDNGKVNDYQFQKIKGLPNTARKYEKTIFNQLFSAGNLTKVSSHNQKFASTMASARTELDAHVRAKNFYVPGTRGWATWMQVLAWLTLLVGLVGLGLVLFQFSLWFRSRWEIPLSWFTCSALLFVFARIMPKKAGFGQKQYEHLVGFREFVERADKAKLEELVHTNPDYFGMTLPYAIALGIATKWVDQFGSLLTSPPSYYHTSSQVSLDQMQRIAFATMMQQQLDRMAHTLNSTPPAPRGGGGGGSSSSYSSSGSSYSSSGSSGGSSYSSGGGYSGGGYGGGGGSSW